MAIGYLNVAIIGRSEGRSAVSVAAYASRSDLVDERTGTAYRYARRSGDLVSSFVWLPKNAPEHLRDRATLWNEVEKAETRKNSQLARRIIIALPHELTTKQQEQLLQDFVRENFTRKGLAVDANIHAPDPNGDDRNDHAHLLIPTRFMDKSGLGKKDRESNGRAALGTGQANWEKLANRQLERYGHAPTRSFKTPEGQTPQIHLGPEATALERQGVETRAGDGLREIVNDNERGREVANDLGRAVGKEVEQPQTIDRDARDATWQDTIDSAALAYAEERRRQFLQTQAIDRATFERHGAEMTTRHAASWGEVMERHHAEAAALIDTAPTGYQSGSMEEAGEAMTGAASFFLSLFTSLAESITRSVTGSSKAPAKRQRGSDKAQREQERQTQRQAEQQREEHGREIAAVMQEQAREQQAYERRRALMLFQQAGALQHFEQQIGDKSSMREAFEVHTAYVEAHREGREQPAEAKDNQPQSIDRDGPELSG